MPRRYIVRMSEAELEKWASKPDSKKKS